MEKAIYVITGVMASGKSTVAEALARSVEKGVHLRGDVFRKMIVTGREEMCDNPSKEALSQLELQQWNFFFHTQVYDYSYSPCFII